MSEMYKPYQQPGVIIMSFGLIQLADVVPAGPVGFDSGESILRGRIREYTAATAGGRFEVIPQFGLRVHSVAYNTPGTLITLSMVKDDLSMTVDFHTAVAAVGVYSSDQEILIPPGWHLACTTPIACTGAGGITIEFAQGLGPSVFDYFGNMGSENRVPNPPPTP